jgi:hypothetical protein
VALAALAALTPWMWLWALKALLTSQIAKLKGDLNAEFQRGLDHLRRQFEDVLNSNLEQTRMPFQVDRVRKEAEHRQAGLAVEEAARRVAKLEDAKTEAQVQGIQRDVRRLDRELRLALEERELAIQRADQAEHQQLEMARLQREQERQTSRERAQLDNRLRELAEQHRQEVDRLTHLDQMSVHALIAVSDTSKAPLLAGLVGLEIKAGMSPQQLLAMAVEKNPDLFELATRALQRDESTKDWLEELRTKVNEILTKQEKLEKLQARERKMAQRYHGLIRRRGHKAVGPPQARPELPRPGRPE